MRNKRSDYVTQEGPKTYIIPRQEIKICSGCKYWEHRLVKSGNHPIYRTDCTHPSIERASSFASCGNLDGFSDNGLAETPDWCPYLQEQNKINTVNTEI